MSSKVTILGSSGQIGFHLTSYLRSKNYSVEEFDIVRSEDEDLRKISNSLLEQKIKDSDFIFFLAFDVGGSRYLSKYQHTYDFIDNNVRIMCNTFDILQKYNKPFVFASSQMSNMSYSPYGILKCVGELYTKSLNGVIAKFWNVYGIEKDYEKSHVITDFIRKGFESDNEMVNMLTDGLEERQFLYADDCCEALEMIMNNYESFSSDDHLHITSFKNSSIREVSEIISDLFSTIGKKVNFVPSKEKDIIQMNKKNEASDYITKWWFPKTDLKRGIEIIFNHMKKDYYETY